MTYIEPDSHLFAMRGTRKRTIHLARPDWKGKLHSLCGQEHGWPQDGVATELRVTCRTCGGM